MEGFPMRHRLATAAALGSALMLGATAGSAQSPVMPSTGGERVVEVAVNYSMNLPLKSDDAAAVAKALEGARKAMYEIAASECTVILATIASSCALTRLNVQSNMQRHAPGQEMAHVSANASYKVGLREAK